MRFFAIAFLALLLPVAAATPPRVLILGDSIYLNPSQEAAKFLKDKAVVVRSNKSGEVFNTTTALANLDELLGTGKWDLIHFNFGLGDLVHRAPNMKAFRSMPMQSGGIRTTPPADYAKNLTEIVKRLKATRAKLVWASTTPIQGDGGGGLYEIGSEVEYNAIAAKIMAANRIPVNDMYAAVGAMLATTKSGGGSPTNFGRLALHPPFVAALCRQLSLPVPPGAENQPEPRRKR
jgi:acyl-CoA thioesterase-1